jgi:hypothetical protein
VWDGLISCVGLRRGLMGWGHRIVFISTAFVGLAVVSVFLVHQVRQIASGEKLSQVLAVGEGEHGG